jgi:hypothetical protein
MTDNTMIFYWTDSVTEKGTKVYADKEKAEVIISRYFEATIAPLPAVKYHGKAIPWPGMVVRKGLTRGAETYADSNSACRTEDSAKGFKKGGAAWAKS